MVVIMLFYQFIKPKIAVITLGKVVSAIVSGQNRKIEENTVQLLFIVFALKLFLFHGRKK